MKFECLRCGAEILATGESAPCAECRSIWDSSLMLLQQTDYVPAVDCLRASKMLGRSKEWIEAQRKSQSLPAIYRSGVVEVAFAISAIRLLAAREGIDIRSLDGDMLLLPRAPARSGLLSGGPRY
jgi:hypothetical protein